MENNEKNFKIKNKFLIVFIIAIVIGGLVGVYCYLQNNNTPISTEYYAVFDDGTYYIPKADENVKFEVTGNNLNLYKLTNSNNDIVESKIVEQNGKKYIQANQKYEKGETYQLILEDAKFADESLSDAKKLEFKIESEPKAEYKMYDNVITIDSKNIQVEEETKLKVQNATLRDGQVILVKDGKDIKNAYKVTNVDGEDVVVSQPVLSEIYSNVELYTENQIDFNNLKINEDAKIEIEKIVKESALYKFLSNEVYADFEEPKISFKVEGKDIAIEIELRFKADGEEKLGLDVLKQHDLLMRLSYKISADYMLDIKKDFSMNFDMAVKNQIGMKVELKTGNAYVKGISEISDEEYSKSVQEIVQKLQNEVPDVSANSIDIGAIEVPTAIPGINVYMDVYLQTQLALQINLNYNGELECIDHFGFVMNKDEARAYQNASQSSFSQEFSVTGKAEIKIGIGLDVGISFINKDIAHAGVGAEFGAYNEYFATLQVNLAKGKTQLDSGIYAKIELGIYLQVKVDCSIDALFFRKDYKQNLVEIKIPVLKLGDEVVWSGDGVKLEENTNTNLPTPNNSTATSNAIDEKTEIDSMPIDTASDSIKAYKQFILDKKYLEDYKEYAQTSDHLINEFSEAGYCIFDINQDGTPELIINSLADADSREWNLNMIYTYDVSNKSVIKVELIYNYCGIRYEKNEKEIVYSEYRPSFVFAVYSFSKLENNQLISSKLVGHDRGYYDVENETYATDNHFYRDATDQEKSITEDEEKVYFSNVIDFIYQDIATVK